MRLMFQIAIALIALGWSGVAAADSADPSSFLDPSFFTALTDLDLDAAFEQATSPDSTCVLYGLGGPTTMRCKNDKAVDDLETCVVTAESTVASTPAALSQP